MHITWLGQSCFKLEVKSQNEDVIVLIDPFDPAAVGLKLPRTITADVVLQTGDKLPYPVETRDGKRPFVIGNPGEYEVKGIFIYAIPLKQAGAASPQHIFWIEAEQIVLVHPRALTLVPTEAELQEIEGLDVLFVPVGGNGVLDAKKAAELVSELEPRIVIPMMYKVEGLKTKADEVAPFLKAVGAKSEQLPKLKVVKKDLPVDDMKVVVLEKS